jgi:GntR family transcriptional regulator, rspAB operon transcriptional repressor
MPKKAKAPKTTITERAYHAIKRAILLGTIREGSFLSEEDIRRSFGFGRTPFREACNRLHNERVLEVVPHRGYFVPELTFRAVRDLFEARLVLEASIAELAAVRAELEQINELETLAKRLLTFKDSRNNYDRIVNGNTEFHLCLARMTQNHELVELARRILDHVERLSYIEFRSAGFKRELAQKLHGPIVDAIRRRDSLAARQAVLADIAQAQIFTTGIPGQSSMPSPLFG